MFVDGKQVTFGSSLEARRAGIETVYQDLSLAPDLSVWANIFLGREQAVKGPLRLVGWLDRKAMAREAEADLERTRIRIGSVKALAGRLSGGQRQAIAVGRAVAWGSKAVSYTHLDVYKRQLGYSNFSRSGLVSLKIRADSTMRSARRRASSGPSPGSA